MQTSFGTSREDRLIPALLPSSVKIDEREVSELLASLVDYAQYLPFIEVNKPIDPNKNWGEFLLNDISVILAKILTYDVQSIDQRRVKILESYRSKEAQGGDTFSDLEEAERIDDLILEMVDTIDFWYLKLKSSIGTTFDPPIILKEFELLIKNKLYDDLQGLIKFYQGVIENGNEAAEDFKAKYEDYEAKWRFGKEKAKSRSMVSEALLKSAGQLSQFYLNFYNAIIYFQGISRKFFADSLENKHDHAPPVGLLITFLHLLTHAQDHLNQLSTKHLEYYYEKVLGIKPLEARPDEVFVYFEPGEFEEKYLLEKTTEILGEKNAEGIAPVYRTVEDLLLSKAKIDNLKTVFVSKNDKINMGSSYALVSNIYAAPLANSLDGHGTPFVMDSHWPLFGEDQLDKVPANRTMQKADVGFVISSPVLFLKGGERSINVTFSFEKDSMKNYRMLMEDIIRRMPHLSFGDLFYKVFQNSISIHLSGEEGWVKVEQYELIPPDNIVDHEFEIGFVLGADEPSIVANNPEILNNEFSAEVPLMKVQLGGVSSNYIYSFVRDFLVEKIDIKVDVKYINDLDLYNNLGQIDHNLPFLPFGPMPMANSYLAIGYPEAFKKELTSLKFHIEWLNLPKDEKGFAGFYEAYEKDWNNESFEANLTALSKSTFKPVLDAPQLTYTLFETERGNEKLYPVTEIEISDLSRLDIRPDYHLDPVLNFDNNTSSGFFKLELINPPEAFGHDIYPKIFAEVLTFNSLPPARRLFGREAKNELKPIPNEPYTPMIRSLNISYSAETSINMGIMEAKEREGSAPEYIYHIQPFGYQEVFVKGRVLSTRWLPQFEDDGYLYIGLSHLKPPQTLTIYFEFTENLQAATTTGRPKFSWTYLADNEWHPLLKEQILADGTAGFSHSGIVKLSLPYDINRNNTILSKAFHWIRIGARGYIHLVEHVQLIQTQAVKAQWVPDIEDTRHLYGTLMPNTLNNLVKERPEILAVFQPYPSFGGLPPESKKDFYVRVSERLRHKGRGITYLDLEQLVLANFPQIAQVKCLSNLEYPQREDLEAGKLVVVVIPRTSRFNGQYKAYANVHLLNRIKHFLVDRISPFVQLTVRNPSYEMIQINCDVVFSEAENSGEYIQQLNKEINEYLAPWLQGIPATFPLGGSINKEVVMDFIEKREYVNFVTKFSIIQIITTEDGYSLVRDTANEGAEIDIITAYTPWSVLIPFERHQITPIEKEAYEPGEPSTLENISVGVDFIVRDEEEMEKLYGETEGENILDKPIGEIIDDNGAKLSIRLSPNFDLDKLLDDDDFS